MIPVLGPSKFSNYVRQLEDASNHEAFQRLVAFCDKRRQHSDPPVIKIPESWAPVILNCLSRMAVVEPSIRIRRIANEDGKLRIYHNYCPRNKDKLDEIKVNTYNAIDRFLLKRIGKFLKSKNGASI
jgi:hypothetical protein